MSSLASYLNELNRRSTNIERLNSLNVGFTYQIQNFEKLTTQYGDVVVATLKYNGPLCSQNLNIRVYMPKRFARDLTEDIIHDYNDSSSKISLVYRGITNRKYDIEFISH